MVTASLLDLDVRVTTGVMARTAVMALAWLVAGWTMARARETRVLLPCALWLVAAVS